MAVLHSSLLRQNRTSSLGLFSPLWHPIPKEVFLPKEEVHLYCFPIPLPLHFLNTHLCEEEKKAADKFLSEKARQEYTASRAALRFLLSKILCQSPCQIPFREGPFGKPYVKGTTLRFNLAHTCQLGIIALSWEEELGVDIEEMRTRHWERLVKHFFSPREQKEFEKVPLSLRCLSFYLGWTRKEAYLKAWGRGLSLGLSRFSVSLAPEKGEIYHFHTAYPRSYQLFSFYIPQNILGSLLILGEGKKKLRFFQWLPKEGKL